MCFNKRGEKRGSAFSEKQLQREKGRVRKRKRVAILEAMARNGHRGYGYFKCGGFLSSPPHLYAKNGH